MGRGRGPLPPYVSMMPVVPDGAPRFVEESHGQGAGILGPVHNPMRIDADGAKPGYRVGEFEPRTDVTTDQLRDREGLLRALDARARKYELHAGMEAMGSHYGRAFSLLSTPAAARAWPGWSTPTCVRCTAP